MNLQVVDVLIVRAACDISVYFETSGFETDKQLQLGDWRLRPLPADMLKYAQADTHYLLYIYDRYA